MRLDISPESDGNGGEIVHNHFNCPTCKVRDASTDAYYNMWEGCEVGTLLKCEECGEAFRLTNRDNPDIEEWLWEIIDGEEKMALCHAERRMWNETMPGFFAHIEKKDAQCRRCDTDLHQKCYGDRRGCGT